MSIIKSILHECFLTQHIITLRNKRVNSFLGTNVKIYENHANNSVFPEKTEIFHSYLRNQYTYESGQS